MQAREILGWQNGIYLQTKNTKIIFDPSKATIDTDANIFISHAHSDHTAGFSSQNMKYSTEATRDIYEVITRKKIKNYQKIFFGKSITFDDVTITPYNAGHILGSAQYRITTPEKIILYTGDINYIDTLITNKADSIKCDTLIIEGTYGNPFYIFPNRERVYVNIVKWLIKMIKSKKSPIFQVYAAGKAQEIIRLINLYTTIPVFTNDRISDVNEIYRLNNYDLDYSPIGRERISKNLIPSIYVTSSKLNIDNERFIKARATGWVLNRFNQDNGLFPLSSHADFYQLIEFIKKTSAKTVYIYTGKIDKLAQYINKKLKVHTDLLPPISQRKLIDF